MKEEFFSEDILNTYLAITDKTKSVQETKKKMQYIIDWLDWLKKKQLISEHDYSHALQKVSKRLEILGKNKFSIPYINRRSLLVFFLGFIVIIILFTYKQYFKNNTTSTISYKSSDSSILPYRGRLLDEKGFPITTKTDITFNIYDSPIIGKALYTGSCRGTQAITPDYTGSFTVVLGSDCDMPALPKILFENRVDLYLGVQMANSFELTPRQKIFTSAYSSDAARLQGLTVGTNKGSIPFINKVGEVIFKHTNPYLKTLDGTFTIESPEISIKTTGKDNASILFQPASAGNTIVSNGKFGVGTSTPVSLFTAQAVEPYATVGTLTNFAPEDNESMSVLNLHISTSTKGTESRFIQFFAGASKENNGELVGSIRLNNEGVAYETAGADFAEYFETNEENIPPGYIMTISPEGIHRSKKGEKIIGVTSDVAGFIGNKKDTNKKNALIGIKGQIDVYVLNARGNIRKGDIVGLSDVEGYGQKQDGDSNVLGIALENFAEHDEERCPDSIKTLPYPHIVCKKIRILLK